MVVVASYFDQKKYYMKTEIGSAKGSTDFWANGHSETLKETLTQVTE